MPTENDGTFRSFALSITTAAGTVLLPACTEIMLCAEENDDISALKATTQAAQVTILEINAIGD